MARTTPILLSITISCLLTALTGCSHHDGASMEAAIDQYENGAISLAKIKAQSVYEQGGPQAPEAAWLIGLCDYRHGRTTAARAAFELAAASPDPELSARAKAMIGQTLLDDGQPAAAAVQFEHAWPDLAGEDRARCAAHAATAWSQVGRDDLAMQWVERSRLPATPATDGVLANQPERTNQPAAGPFTLQAGAYKKPDGAQRAREQLSRVVSRAGIGQTSIRTRTDRHGGTLYLVHIGSFSTRQQAIAASRALGQQEVMVVTVDTSS